MDLTKLSNEDLIALRTGNLQDMSDQGLAMIATEKPKLTPEGYTEEEIAEMRDPNIAGRLGEDLYNLGKGAVSGVADIGDTILNAGTYLPGKFLPSVEKWNKNRTEGLEAYNQENSKNTAFNIGRVGGNIVGTMGAPGVVAKGVTALSKAPKALQFAEALRTGGMSAKGGGMGTRIAGGAGSGATMTSLVDPESAGYGAAIGGVLPPAVKLANTAGKGAMSMVQPFYQNGRNKILGRMLRSTAGSQADDVVRNLENSKELVPGSKPTSGMVAKNPGIAALERSSVSNNTVAANELATRQAANNEARIAAIHNVTPDKEAATTLRQEITEALYDQASKANVNLTDKLTTLLARPSMKKALIRAKKLASENGETFDINKLTGRGAQYIKMSLDDMANAAPKTGVGGNELRAIKATRTEYLDEIGKQVPEYLEANLKYAQGSKPINQAEIIDDVLESGTNKVSGNLTPAAFTKNFSDKTAQKITGQKGAKISEVLEPDQLNVLGSVEQDLKNMAFASREGLPVGSNTVQNLAYTNMLNRFGVPTMLRNNSIAGTIGNMASQVGNLGYKKANERLSAELAELLLDPKKAAHVMANANVSPKAAEMAKLLQNYTVRSAPVIGIPAIESQR